MKHEPATSNIGVHADGKEPHELLSGEYAKYGDIWYARVPSGKHVANLGSHKITEHEDGTITASPSILTSDGKESWHGFLERGVWREC